MANLKNLRMTVAYDGGRYRGFEVQPHTRTIRGAIEQAILAATGERVRIHAGGRTDAGVHAQGQVVSFFSRSTLPLPRLLVLIDKELGDEIGVVKLEAVERAFHARHSAIARRYRYQITTRKAPLLRHQSWWVRDRLDVDVMRQVLESFEGRHDFSAFGDLEEGEDGVATIQEVALLEEPPLLSIEIMAERFLWHMARRMVGAAVAVGRGQLSREAVAEALAVPGSVAARGLKAHTAPPQGLVLLRVVYPGDLRPAAATFAPVSP